MKTALIALTLLFAATANATIVTVANTNDSFALDSTYGRKCVVYGGTTHCVYVVNGTIAYATSANGWTWSAGPSIGTGSQPAIAVTSTGQIGIVYKSASGIEYRYRSGAAWSAPTLVTSDHGEPAIAAYGQRMYVAWNWGHIMTADFVANAPPATVSANMVAYITTSTGAYFGRQKIAIVVLPPKNTQQPLIRIAWFESQVCNGAPYCVDFFRLVTADGPAAMPWPQITVDNYGTYITNDGVSLSMAAEGRSGDVYLLASATTQAGTHTVTRMYKQNAFSGGAYKSHQLLTTHALGTIAAAPYGCGSQFRIALTEYPLTNTLGPTWFRGGTWDAATPAWSSAAVPLGNGRSPQVLFGAGTNEVRTVFADLTALRADVVSSGVAAPDCVSTD